MKSIQKLGLIIENVEHCNKGKHQMVRCVQYFSSSCHQVGIAKSDRVKAVMIFCYLCVLPAVNAHSHP